ncbi:restriction endonuclease subunit S [Limosilactobacillus reuteri]|uniref:restriction endonuclease subunit S n=1 Tax=Limosilactobacillus reuteri TaxID=1598 RepID=UPI0012E27805|nr:restriction endonuclease subunit S [Limosilactobacillus reuteri]
MKYKWKKLDEIAEVTKLAGFEFTKYIDYVKDGKIIALRALNIKNGELDLSNVKRISKEVSEKLPRSKVNKDEILLTYTGNSYGNCVIINENDKYHLAPNVCKITPNKNLVEPYFLYCYINSYGFRKQMEGNISGSAQPTIPMKAIRKLKVPMPDMNIQKNISKNIKIIDEKIRNNKQINDNLISQLKIISNSYFSYFEVYNGKIPLDWSYTKLVDIANIDAGYSYTSKELVDSNIAMATIKNFDRTGGFNIRGFKEIKPNKIVKKEKYAKLFDILVAHTDLTQNADIIGNAEPILNTSKYSKIIYSMDLVKVTPKAEKISPFLLALLLQGDRFKKHCLGYVNGTTVLHLSKKALKEFEFPFPTSFSDLDNIAKFAERNYKLIANNMKENQKLQNLKQVLLSKYF